jgi:hypothetical protein
MTMTTLGDGPPAPVAPVLSVVIRSTDPVSTTQEYREPNDLIPILRAMSHWAWPIRVVLFGIASGLAFLIIRPVHAGQVGFDMAASVLYFERIVAGRHLEAFISATPKPLFTLVDGAIYQIAGDWRPISWLAIVVYGIAVVALTELAWRMGGPAAAGFAAVAAIGSTVLLEDASLAYAVSWAVVGWAAAGLLVSDSRPRYLLAGLALAIAGMARFETLLLDLSILIVLIALRFASRRNPGLLPPASAWWLLLGFLALPVQMLHDVLLTGDPFWSEGVPAIASRGVPVMTPLETVRWISGHYVPMAPILLLAALGVVVLVRSRRWAILVGITALGPGILAFLVFLSVRGVYISDRYLGPPDLVALFAAAVGVGGLRAPAVRSGLAGLMGPRQRASALRVAAAVLGGAAALALVRPFAPVDPALARTIRANLAGSIHLADAEPAIAAALSSIPGARDIVPPAGAPDDGISLLVPVLLRPRIAVDLDVPLSRIAGTSGQRLTTSGDYPAPGQLIYHDRVGDAATDAFRLLEVSVPTPRGSIIIDPLIADPAQGIWLDAIRSP